MPESLENQIDSVINENTIKICQTGLIKLVTTKLDPAKSDTLFYGQTIKTPWYDMLAGGGYTTASHDAVEFKYLTKTAVSVDFLLTIKKENGLISETTQNVVLEPAMIKELEIDY